MSTNCCVCIVHERTGNDLLCDGCRAAERLQAMADDNGQTWDLSPNDKEALRIILGEREIWAPTMLPMLAKDHRAMDALRAGDGYNGFLDQFEDTEGNPFFFAEVGAWGRGESADPADAIIKAQEANDAYLRKNPVTMEEKQ